MPLLIRYCILFVLFLPLAVAAELLPEKYPLTKNAVTLVEQGKIKLGVKKLLEAAEIGEAQAQFAMYNIYLQGWYEVKRSNKTAMKWLEKAVAQNYDVAQYELGRRIYTSNTKRSLDLLLNSAAQGNQNAQSFYTKYSVVNGRIPASYEITRAASWAAKGNVYVMDWLGTAYYHGNITKKNLKLAAAWSLRAAKKGSLPSKHRIGIMLDLGWGIKQNSDQANRWLTEAAKAKYQPAVDYLAVIQAGKDWAALNEVEPSVVLATESKLPVMLLIVSLRCRSCLEVITKYAERLAKKIENKKIQLRLIDASYFHGSIEVTAVTQCLITKNNRKKYFFGLVKYVELLLAQDETNQDGTDGGISERSQKEALTRFKKLYPKQTKNCNLQKNKKFMKKIEATKKIIKEAKLFKGFPTFYFDKQFYTYKDLDKIGKILKAL